MRRFAFRMAVALILLAVLLVLSLALSPAAFRATQVSFQSSDGNWADTEFAAKGRGFEQVLLSFELFRLQCEAGDVRLERITARPRWYQPSHWFNDYSEPKWRVPYAEPWPYTEGGAFPPAHMAHCANEPLSAAQFRSAELRAREALASLRNAAVR